MNYLSLLKKKIAPTYLGVDIGTTSIKVVEVKQGRQLPLITNYGVLELSGNLTRANKVLQTSTLKIFEDEVADMLRTLVKSMKTNTTDVIASLPPFSVFTTVLDFPDMAPEELQKTLSFQARQYIPMSIDDVAIDYIKVGEYEDDRMVKHQQILLISVPKEQIRKHQALFKRAGLNLAFLELEELSLVRALVGADPTPTLIVDIGSRSTNIVFCAKGQMLYAQQSDYASATLTQALSATLNINPMRAEELKRERGIAAVGENYELSTVMVPYVDVILNEVKKAQYNYAQQFPSGAKMERILLSGGGSNLLGLSAYMQSQLQMTVVKAAPFVRFEYSPSLEPLLPQLAPQLSIALGLTLREFI